MTALTWDNIGERFFETGVDRGVLYIPDSTGAYTNGYAWNGLTSVTESPSGAEASAQYADNIKYLNLIAAEEFGATIEAFTYPDEFAQCDGTISPTDGVTIGQQTRKMFGLSYRTRLGNDLEGTDLGYKLHLIYGATAAPTEKAYSTINDSPEAISFSWSVSTTPAPVMNHKPTSIVTVNSLMTDPAKLAMLEAILYGSPGIEPSLPTPEAVFGVFGTMVEVRLTNANAPSYDSETFIVTIPAVTGVSWRINGSVVVPGARPPIGVAQSSAITAHAANGYRITGNNSWTFDR